MSAKPRMVRPGSAKASDPRDELLKKLSKNFRKTIENREQCTTQIVHGLGRSVKFNPATVDVSIGGTETAGFINMDTSTDTSSMSVSTCSSTSTSMSENEVSVIEVPIEHCPKVITNRVPTSVPRITTDHSIDSPVRKLLGSRFQNSGISTPVSRPHTSSGKCVGPTPECYQPVDFDTPVSRGIKHRRSSSCELDSTTDEDGSSITVAVRVRPFSSKEQTKSGVRCVMSMADSETVVTSEGGQVNRFMYDHSFWSHDHVGGIFADQEYVYNMLAQPMLGRAFEGYNVCLFAYGQTGSGKSYSIMGTPSEPGVIPRFCEELFGRICNQNEDNLSMNVEISFFEIYNEKIHDLLALGNTNKVAPGKRLNLKVREDPVLGPFVEGLSKYVVRSFDDIKGWLSVGNKHRATAATGMNEKSSRSHSVFTMVLTQTRTDWIEGEEHDHSIMSKINLVDLAGSERQSHAKTTGDRLREGASINKSLHTLGKVISLLSEQSNSQNKKKKVFIPYRDSVLTWLLKESLGGNSKTAMLATVGPADTYIEETLSTLRYANQARSIINLARVNEDSNARLIRELRAEIDKLRTQTGSDMNSPAVTSSSLAEVVTLREKLNAKEREMAEMTRSWQERLMRSEERKQEEARLLEQSGISFQVDNNRPSLVNLNEDPQLSETLLYILKDGKTHIGRQQTGDIQLLGPLIAEKHCIINSINNTVSVVPLGEAPTYVNGCQITAQTVLHHGDRVILGGDHYFRLNHPVEAQAGRRSDLGSTPSKGVLKDFEFAKQELVRVQDAKLQEELEAAKRRHLEEMEQKLEWERNVAQQQLEREVARKRQEAEAELHRQQLAYERRLAELEKALWDQKADQQETEQDRLRAQQRIQTLEREKDMLETEVLSNMKKLEQDARASQKTMAESRYQHSRLVDQLERERHKIQKDVERIEQIRLRRGNTPSTPRFTPAKLPGTSSENLYRFTLLLREANKISQYFKKDVTYSFEMVEQGDSPQTIIKVTNTKLNISTFWPRHKFEERLHHMRELFQSCDPETQSAELDDVFCDINDTWAKSDRGVSPKVLENLKKPRLRGRLSFESVGSSVGSPHEAVASPLVQGDGEKMGAHGESIHDESVLEMPTVSNLCRDLISSALGKFTSAALQESVADKILLHCEVIKSCITTTLEAFNQATEAGVQRSVFVDSPAMRINSIRLTSHLEVLLSQTALWIGSYDSLTSGLIRELCGRIVSTVRKLGSQLVLFLQGCENDLDTLVQESAGQALSSLFSLSKHCGELALATETSMMVLTMPTRGSTDSEEDVDFDAQVKVGHDVRQSFLSGCEVFIDKTLHGGLRTVDECELQLQTLTDDMSQNMPGNVEAVAQHVALTTACTKTMLMCCQQLQVDLDSTMQETMMEAKPESYYGRSYQRAQGLISHITNLTDTITHFTQASMVYLGDTDSTALRKVTRCAELIQKSTAKLLVTSNTDPAANTSSSFSDSAHDLSMLSESRRDQLEVAAQEVKDATNSLIMATKPDLAREPIVSTPVRGKRVLPTSPVKGTGVTRRNSFSDRTGQQKANVHALRKAFENNS